MGRPAGHRWLPLFGGPDHGFLRRDDDKKHISRHQGTDHCAKMNVCGTGTKDMMVRPGKCCCKQEASQRKIHGLFHEPGSAEQVIDQPGNDKRTDADGNRSKAAGIENSRIYQHGPRIKVVHHEKKAESGEPGKIGLVLKPV